MAGIPDFLALNTTKAPFDNRRCARRSRRRSTGSRSGRSPTSGPARPGPRRCPPDRRGSGATNPYAGGPDVEKAKQILAERASPTPLTINYLGLPQYPELLKTGEVVREQLKAIGIDLDIEPVDVSVWFERFVTGEYEMTSAYQERTIDPDNFYALVLRSGGSINTTGYSNPA